MAKQLMWKLLIIIEVKTMAKQKRDLPPVHPGEILSEEFLKPMHISKYALAKAIHVHPIQISEIVHGERAITAKTAIKLGCYFNMNPHFWINLQANYDLEVAQGCFGNKFYKEIIPYKKAA